MVIWMHLPNTFNPSKMVQFNLASFSYVTARLFNVLDQGVGELFHGRLNAGEHVLRVNAASLSLGINHYHIQAGDNVGINTMVLMK